MCSTIVLQAPLVPAAMWLTPRLVMTFVRTIRQRSLTATGAAVARSLCGSTRLMQCLAVPASRAPGPRVPASLRWCTKRSISDDFPRPGGSRTIGLSRPADKSKVAWSGCRPPTCLPICHARFVFSQTRLRQAPPTVRKAVVGHCAGRLPSSGGLRNGPNEHKTAEPSASPTLSQGDSCREKRSALASLAAA
jgi:hypothetical protein